MKLFNSLFSIIVLSIFILSACGNDDEDAQPTSNLTISGIDSSPSGASTYEVKNDEVVVRIGTNPGLIMQFPLATGETMISTGTFTATATLTNDPQRVYTQYNDGFDIYYAQSGSITVTEAANGVITGSVNIGNLETTSDEAISISGDFSATPQ